MPSIFESLPNELLDQIIFYLTVEPPSIARIHQVPDLQIARCETQDLKNLSGVSSHIRALVRPRLFAHACLDLKDESGFRSFIVASDLAQYVTSVVITTEDVLRESKDQEWWRHLLAYLSPRRITVVAPPTTVGALLDTQIMDGHSWAFEIPLQILQLERDIPSGDDKHECGNLEQCDNLLLARPWTSMAFNESSSVRAYHHYEYFLSRIPSVLGEWGHQLTPRGPPPSKLLHMLQRLEYFSYTAVFPFFNHVELVLQVLSLMPNVKKFDVKLVPDEGNRVLEQENRASLDLNDPWTELMTSYNLIATAIGKIESLREVRSWDLANPYWQVDVGMDILEELQRPDEFGHAGGVLLVRGLPNTKYSDPV